MKGLLNASIWLLSVALSSAHFSAIDRVDLEASSNDDELVFASVIYRHGGMNIQMIYPNDPYKDEKYWPEGFGQITKDGIRRQYRLGQYLRRRYNDLLGDGYSFKKVYVQSSDYDRCIMSAQSNLAGLFMPTPEEEWNGEIKWQPIPVHMLPRSLDHIIAIERVCPKYNDLRAKYIEASEEHNRIFNEYAEEITHWSKMSGLNLTTTSDICWLYNTLDIEREQNKTLPEWAEDAIKRSGLMGYIATFDFSLYADTPELARFASGFLIKEIVEHFSQKANSTLDPDRSLWIYSGHEFSIVNALNSLGLYDKDHIPPYASSVHFELSRNDGNEYHVQMFYRRLEEEHPSPLNIPGCGEKCPLNEFINLCQKFIPQKDVESECRL